MTSLGSRERMMVLVCLNEVISGLRPSIDLRPDRPASKADFDRFYIKLSNTPAPDKSIAASLDLFERQMALFALKTTSAELDYDAELQTRTGYNRHELCLLITRLSSGDLNPHH